MKRILQSKILGNVYTTIAVPNEIAKIMIVSKQVSYCPYQHYQSFWLELFK